MCNNFFSKLFKRKKKSNLIVVDGNKVPADEMGNPNYSFLVGKTGECITDLKPIGKAKICGHIFTVKSEKGYLYNGNFVEVVKTESTTIYVKKIKASDLKD